MSKIVCEVCGTSYPETAEQCPICGCVRPSQSNGVISDNENAENRSGYTYVKGGRFSKNNVRKRLKANPPDIFVENEDDEEEEYESRSGRGLVITAIILLLSIIAVIIYITIRFLTPAAPAAETTQNTTAGTEQVIISCTGLTVDSETISLAEPGNGWQIRPQIEPANTTDVVLYTSKDPNVATVTEDGVVTAVGAGQTVIVVTCGEQRVECSVICEFAEPTEDTTEDTTSQTTDGVYTEEDIIFNTRYNPPEATLRSEGETWNCYKGNIPVEEITWKSDDESVATVKDGIVTAVGAGKTEIHAIWGDIDLVCVVRCNFITTPTGIPGSDAVGEG